MLIDTEADRTLSEVLLPEQGLWSINGLGYQGEIAMCWKCDEAYENDLPFLPLRACLDYERDLEIQRKEYEDFDPQWGE